MIVAGPFLTGRVISTTLGVLLWGPPEVRLVEIMIFYHHLGYMEGKELSMF